MCVSFALENSSKEGRAAGVTFGMRFDNRVCDVGPCSRVWVSGWGSLGGGEKGAWVWATGTLIACHSIEVGLEK